MDKQEPEKLNQEPETPAQKTATEVENQALAPDTASSSSEEAVHEERQMPRLEADNIEKPLRTSVSSVVENSTPSAVKRKPRSVAIFPMNLGGSNGARLELEAIFVPPYNAARYGITMTSSPKQADVIFLLGNGTIKTLPYALELLAGLPDEVKLVVLGSDGPIARDIGKKGYMVRGLKIPISSRAAAFSHQEASSVAGQPLTSIDEFVLPPGKKIAAYLTGSPPDPQSIIDFILQNF